MRATAFGKTQICLEQRICPLSFHKTIVKRIPTHIRFLQKRKKFKFRRNLSVGGDQMKSEVRAKKDWPGVKRHHAHYSQALGGCLMRV